MKLPSRNEDKCNITINERNFEALFRNGSAVNLLGYFGNLSLVYKGERDTGEDFCVDLREPLWGGNSTEYQLYTKEPIQLTTFSVIGEETLYFALDERYIPSSIARVSNLRKILPEATTNDNGKVLGVVNGKWAAMEVETDVEVTAITIDEINEICGMQVESASEVQL
jgi:hypothetical protein